MGKLESSPDVYQFSEHYLPWHAHITAVTVAPEARRLGIGKLLTEHLEAAADANNAWFVDLFVRSTNHKAIASLQEHGVQHIPESSKTTTATIPRTRPGTARTHMT